MAQLLQVRSSIPIQCVCAVERVDENAFQQQNVMQVITQDNDGQLHTMYIQCKVHSIGTDIRQSPNKLMTFFSLLQKCEKVTFSCYFVLVTVFGLELWLKCNADILSFVRKSKGIVFLVRLNDVFPLLSFQCDSEGPLNESFSPLYRTLMSWTSGCQRSGKSASITSACCPLSTQGLIAVASGPAACRQSALVILLLLQLTLQKL